MKRQTRRSQHDRGRMHVTYGQALWIFLMLVGVVTVTAAKPHLQNSEDHEGHISHHISEKNSIEETVEPLALVRKPMNEDPMQLIRPGKGHDRLELNETVLEILAQLEEPVSIVGIVGPYHGGKSFLLNVFLNSTHGFPVGIKPEPETKGIWVRFVSKQQLTGIDGSPVILLDTEGFYGERATRLYDARIFAIATLLSSHLVYNTVRTLGDTQSVSALADLAKQAQVFNLHNWLHSGEMALDQPSLSGNVSASLLLKTLDFPPLTWVVQGFDMELESSRTPMDYLQRYLSAFAHTGDRTLDTLFTKGIACYALRTPTDFNQLREQYGSKVLAADDELYTQLHPAYISDLNMLRNAVFGNLKAKGDGKLSGRAVASLLPLLVHYVNEDFPLHADRKLRDVLVDIIVDGAFSGGVEYFQKCMQETSLIDEVIKSSRVRKLVTNANDLEKMSALANSALTAEELEAVMNAAEQRAIVYCRQRCVGVPQDSIAMSCDVQLGVKINNMKPSYRDENERKVREVLVRLGEGLHATAGKKVLDVKLPIADLELQKMCGNVIQEVLNGYEELVGPHKGSHLYHEARIQMQEEIQAKCEKVARINAEKISSIFAGAKTAFRNEYEHGFLTCLSSLDHQLTNKFLSNVEDGLKEVTKPLSQNKLEEIHILNVKVAGLAFEKGVKDALPWMGTGNDLYDFYHFQCLQWLKQRFSEIQAHNHMLIRAYCEKAVSDLLLQFKSELSNITPFPDNDETISEKAEERAKHVMQEYLSMVKDYSSFSVVEEKRRELAYSTEASISHLLKKNTALMAAFCYDPLMDAYKELQMQDCERTLNNMWITRSWWSPKCLWPGPKYIFGFKYAAFKVARKHLDQAQATGPKSQSLNHETAKGVLLSTSTINKVIQAWIEHDLANYANIVLVNFSILTACLVVILSTILWMVRKLHRCSKMHRNVKMESEERSSWGPYDDSIRFKSDYRTSGFYKRY